MKLFRTWLLFFLLLFALQAGAAPPVIHVWETQELTFVAKKKYSNPYTDVIVWIDLTGPGFHKRVYGFWDGDSTYRVRLVAMLPGTWKWTSGCNTADEGLQGHSGSYTAIEWNEQEKNENPLRRGFIRATPNGHALMYADSTPYFAIGDTWFPLGASRFKWYDDDKSRPMGPDAGFKDYVKYRQAQGYNWVCMIAAFPNWKTDDSSWHIILNDSARSTLRSAWVEYGTGSAKNMDNEGGRPFFFPGKVPGYEDFFPDMDRINPEYFKYIDRKIAYLNAHGFVPFIEVARRDMGMVWFRYYDWPGSYARFIQYIYARYQAYNTVLAPVHLDIIRETITPDDYLLAIKAAEQQYGPPPFENLLSANAHPSTLENWGENSWVTLHQTGNRREHDNYWYLTEIFNLPQPRPALNGEPYYAGYKDARGGGGRNYSRGAEGGSERDDAFCRSGMYGSVLSGGLAGHVYGAEGIWGADIEAEAPVKMWEAFQWKSGAQMRHLKSFVFSIGNRYQELVPLADLVSPNKTHDILGYEGWAYCARTPDKNIFLGYFEKGCIRSQIRGARLNSVYRAQWYDPRNGKWLDVGDGKLHSSTIGIIRLPDFPGEGDWGLKLVYEGPVDKNARIIELVNDAKPKGNIRRIAVYAGVGMIVLLVIWLLIKRRRAAVVNQR